MSIEHGIALPDGSVANTVGPSDVIAAMYPAGLVDDTAIYIGVEQVDNPTGIRLRSVNSVLRFQELEDGRTAISGNTVTRLCPIAADCGNCALAGAGLTTAEMSARNCARANTAMAYELAGVPPEGRFMLLPTSKNAYVVNEERLTPEHNGDELMQNRLQAASSVVFTGSWLREQGLDEIAVGMHGADGSSGVAITKIEDETVIIGFASLRQHMGDREPEDQVLRQALNAYFDSQGFDAVRCQRALASMDISITLAASATLKYFAHKIEIPRDEDGVPQGQRDYAVKLNQTYPDLIARAGGRITSAIVLNDQYPGAMERGSIFPEFEAIAGIRETPITPDNCPGEGTCHIAYREETDYALRKQLVEMGVPDVGIRFDDSEVLDPADPSNNAASNRAEQNNGVKVKDTNRTLNAVVVRL
jgi:hypothetical protein